MTCLLFDKGPADHPSPSQVAQAGAGRPRLRVPHRDQIEMHWVSLDELLEADHRARLVWAAVAGLRLDGWLAEIKAVEGNVGRDATDPRLLVALWVYATLQGVGSARELARLCEKHLAYQWLCGGVTVNYHLLADFRSQGGQKWDDLLTQIVAALLAEGLVTLTRVAQDGMRVRASAGKASFRVGAGWRRFWRRRARRSKRSSNWLTNRPRNSPSGSVRPASERRASGPSESRRQSATANNCRPSAKRGRRSLVNRRTRPALPRPIPRPAT